MPTLKADYKPKPRRKGQAKAGKTAGRPLLISWQRRRLAVVVACMLTLIGLVGGGAWLWRSGLIEDGEKRVLAIIGETVRGAGFVIEDVVAVGRVNADRADILEALDVARGDSILAFDAEAARVRLLALGWVREARVSRRLPNTILVHIRERQPLALWQMNRRLALIDRYGGVITDQRLGRFRDLRLLVGEGAAEGAAEIVGMLALEPSLDARVEVVMRIGGRRWSVRFKNGVEARLPEKNPAASWTRLSKLAREHGVLDRDIKVIDLRLPDRLYVRLSPEAAEERRRPGEDT